MRGISLRQFCEQHGFDPANASKVERGLLPPPDTDETVVRYGVALGLANSSPEMRELIDIAATERGKLPTDVMQTPELLKTLPAFFRTLRARKSSLEDEAKDRFLSYLARTRGIPYLTTDADVIVDQVTRRNFDFELTALDSTLPKMALEIFSLVDDENNVAASRLRHQILEKLAAELRRRGVTDFAISTPVRFQLPKAAIDEYCGSLADSIQAITKGNPAIQEFEVGAFKARRYNGLGPVVFSTRHSFCQVDPATSAYGALTAKLAHKESQLPEAGYERVILVLNGVLFVRPADAISALSTMDLDFLRKTDRIFFESTADRFDLVYDRAVRQSLENCDDPPEEGILSSLYHEWLRHRIYSQKPEALRLVRQVSARRGNTLWVPDRQVREAVIWQAKQLAEKGLVNDALWVARHFRRDPDPQTPRDSDAAGDGLSLHEQVKRGEKTFTISSVRGSVCWLLQGIARSGGAELLSQIIEMVEELARDENLYVRQQATVPLLELASLRWLRDADGRLTMEPQDRRRIRDLAFEMLRANEQFPGVLEWLGTVFEYLPDIDAPEARELLNTLLTKCPRGEKDVFPDRLIYFAAYRENDFRERAPFDSREFKNQLSKLLRGEHAGPRAKVVWRISGMLSDNPEDLPKLRGFLGDVVDGPYEETSFFHLFDAINALPSEARTELEDMVARARQKECKSDSECPAFRGAASGRSF